MKPVRLVILLLVLAVVAGAVAWKLQWFFLHNKVTFLLNQRRFDEATELLKNLESKDSTNSQTDFLQVKALTITEEFDEAVEVANAATEVARPEMLYWLALAQYQLGHVAAAADTANRFVSTNEQLPSGSHKLIRALAGTSPIVSPPDQAALDFRLMFPVEKAVFLGLAGLHQWEIGRLDIAAELIRDAFELENRNPRFLTDGAKALALVGDVQGAQMLWDYSGAGSIKPLYEKLQALYRGLQPVSLTLNSDELARGGRKIDVARAVAWAAAILAGEKGIASNDELSALANELFKEYPYDPVLQVHKAALLENSHQPDEALKIYHEIQRKNPSFMVLVRIMAIEKTSDTAFADRAEDFMRSLQPVAKLTPREMQVAGGTFDRNSLHFADSGVCTGTIYLKEPGSYMLTLIAKGTKEKGKWPLLKVSVDDEVAGVNYICRSDWDCYNIPMVIEAGPHTLEWIFEDVEHETTPAIVKRSLFLQSIYVTLTGVAYVR